jgi:membrane fusion protein, multidrug efflux system
MNRPSLTLFSIVTFLGACSSPPPPPPAAVQISTTQPKVCDTPIYLEYPGHIEAYKTVNLQAQVAGTLTGMYFEEGTNVKEGELLFTIDSRPYQAALAKAEATLAGSIAALKYSEETVKRYSKLMQENYVARLDYDQYITTTLENDATVKGSIADIETAKINLGYCTLYAPMDAVAGKKEIDVGNYIEVGESTPLIVLNQINPVYAAFYVPDVDLPLIQKFQRQYGPLTTHIYLNGDYSNLYEGKLTLIDNQVDEATGAIYMKATLPNDEHALWPGEFADVRIVLWIEKNAILVPTQALQLGQKGYYAYVVAKDNTAELRNIEIGNRYEEYTLVKSGIQPTDTVVLEGQLNLYPGAKIQIVPTKEAAPQTLSHFNVKKSLEKVGKNVADIHKVNKGTAK